MKKLEMTQVVMKRFTSLHWSGRVRVLGSFDGGLYLCTNLLSGVHYTAC